jgi:fatty acid elongase 3
LINRSKAYQHFVHKYFPTLPHIGDCGGTNQAILFGDSLITLYLFLFIDFFRRTYKKKTPSPKEKKPVNVQSGSSETD